MHPSGLVDYFAKEKGEKGQTRLENLQELVNAAREYEPDPEAGLSPLDDFLSHAALEAGEGQADAWEDCVQLMTLHSAKGLEFPLVILADSSCEVSELVTRTTDRASGLHATRVCGCAPLELQQREQIELARERAEAVRLLYVAATRARDLLVVPLLPSDARVESWLKPLADELEPWQLPGLSRAPQELRPLRHLLLHSLRLAPHHCVLEVVVVWVVEHVRHVVVVPA